MLVYRFAWFVLIFTTAACHNCQSDLDCSLNGICDTKSGVCTCDAAWKDSDNGKESCSVLRVLPFPDDYVPAYGGPRTSTAWHNQSVTSWGGNILRSHDGRYHLYVSAMADSRGLDSWTGSSEIHHAVADDPMDVFKKEDTVLPQEAHNASPLRAPNGSFLLFHIGNAGDGKHDFLHAADSPEGPWVGLPSIVVDGRHQGCNNPAPMFAANGTAFVGCNNGGFTLYRSDDVFAGGWSKVTTLQFPPEWSRSAPAYLRNEDPYLWMDKRHNFHLLAHRYDYRDGWPKNPNQTEPVLVSGHGFSQDGIRWHFNVEQQPYDAKITFQNGTVQFLSTYERPHLVFDEETHEPTHLVNGVSPYWNDARPCDGCNKRAGSAHSCVVCKTTPGLDFTYTLVSRLAAALAPIH